MNWEDEMVFEPVEEREIYGGWQKIFRFDNGYGASLIRHSFSYGDEMAVLQFYSESNTDYKLVYNTPITDDVLGGLSPSEIDEYLEDISKLTEEIIEQYKQAPEYNDGKEDID
jgi:hypothetical protein